MVCRYFGTISQEDYDDLIESKKKWFDIEAAYIFHVNIYLHPDKNIEKLDFFLRYPDIAHSGRVHYVQENGVPLTPHSWFQIRLRLMACGPSLQSTTLVTNLERLDQSNRLVDSSCDLKRLRY